MNRSKYRVKQPNNNKIIEEDYFFISNSLFAKDLAREIFLKIIAS